MKIKSSRHAKRRAKLYKIPESSIKNILHDLYLPDGRHEIIKDIEGLSYPLKIIVDSERDIITIVTNYPLKKKVQK